MFGSIKLVLLISAGVIGTVQCVQNVTKEMDFESGELVLNDTNQSEANLDRYQIDTNITDSSYFNITNLAVMFNIFDTVVIGQNWPNIAPHLSNVCRRDMVEYFKGLQEKRIWALKMNDASGRYTPGFFWGNNYWTGSATLCDHIITKEHLGDATTAANEIIINEKPISGRDGISYASGYRPGLAVPKQIENPPFSLNFFMAKIQVNGSSGDITPADRQIHLGMCLPLDCSNKDVQIILQQSAESESYLTKHDVLSVRSTNNQSYDLLQDTTFRILCIASVIVSLLLFAGTAYDLYLLRQVRLARQNSPETDSVAPGFTIGCTTYDMTGKDIHTPSDKHVSLDINGIPQTEHISSKNGVFSVNNNNSDENLTVENSIPEEEKLSIFSELILSFSIRINLLAICDRTVGSDTIPTIHGLRSISMAWVILGHTCIVVFKYSDNMELRKVVEKEFMFQAVTNGAFSVDTFFFISGLLVSYLYFRTYSKGKLDKLTKGNTSCIGGLLQFLGLIGYRFARLTAPYLFVLGVVEVIMKWFQYNSVFEPPTLDHLNCPNYWWRNILYINTLFPVEDMCMLWSWYLSDDTQFYVIGAVILIIGVRHFKTATSIVTIFLISSWATTAYIAFNNNHMPSTDDPLALFDKIYDKPWTRLGPYLIGMSVGWLLFKTNCKMTMSKLVVSIGWVLSCGCLIWLVYGLYNTTLNPVTAAAYSALSHSAWALSLAWIVVACSTGYGGYINNLLSCTILYPFSRVTYCAYLIHPIVIRLMPMNSDAPIHLGKTSVVVVYMGQIVSSYILAFIISLAYEAPVVSMLKILAPNRRRRI